MNEKLSSGTTVQKVRDAYIATLEAKMSTMLGSLRELEVANKEKELKGI